MGQTNQKRNRFLSVATTFITLLGILLIPTIIEAASGGSQMIRRRHLNHQSILTEDDGYERRARPAGKRTLFLCFSFFSFHVLRSHSLNFSPLVSNKFAS